MINIRSLTVRVLGRVVEYARDEAPVGKGKDSGKLQQEIQYKYQGDGQGVVGVFNVPYARAVHDGRPALTIVPNLSKNPPLGDRKIKGSKEAYRSKARLKFKIGGKDVYAREVNQPARPPNPFLTRAVKKVESEGFSFLLPYLKTQVEDDVASDLIKKLELDIII